MTITKLVRGAKGVTHPWNNLRITAKLHRCPGAAVVRHVKTGQGYVIATKNLHHTLFALSSKLRAGTCSNPRLLALFQQDPQFQLEIQLFDDEQIPGQVRRQMATSLAASWRTELADKCLNSSHAYLRSGMERERPLQPDPHLPYRGEIRHDFIDRLWFHPDPQLQAELEQARLEDAVV